MISDVSGDWNVAAYEAFHDLRLRPALDLLARVSSLPASDIIDLGCGAGAAGPALRARFPDRRLVGVDASPDMLAKAQDRGLYDDLQRIDIANWSPAAAPALIFSNAALHWLAGHQTLIPRLYAMIAPGGALAVQMPDQLRRPSHQTLIAAAVKTRPDLFADWAPFPGPLDPTDYPALMEGAAVELWSTEYHQRIAGAPDNAHPVRRFSSSTAGAPVLARLSGEEAKAFGAAWDAGLDEAYPRLPDGGAWFPFRRLFFVARKPA